MMSECEEFVLKGPEQYEPLPKETVGKIIFDSLITIPPDQLAMIDVLTHKTITSRKILEEACNLAVALCNYGCTTDTIISISSENSLEYFIPIIASLFAGTIMTPLNQAYTPTELKHSLNISKPKTIFTSQMVTAKFLEMKREFSFIEKIIVIDTDEEIPGTQTLREFCNEHLRDQIVSPDTFVPFNRDAAEQVAFIMCSSGTTGLPKGAMLTHTNIVTRIAQTRDPRYADNFNEPITTIGLLPFFHVFGLNTIITSLVNRHLIIVFKKFDEDTYLQAIQDYKVNILHLAPTLVVFLAKTPKLVKYDLSSIRDCYCGAATLNKDIEDLMKERLNLRTILQGYGQTECNLAISLMDRDTQKPASVGKIILGMTAKIRDPETGKSLPANSTGEVCVKGPQVMKGYYNNEQATKESFTEDGWFRTGDLGYYDDDEYLYIVGRLKELIKYKGYQVAPAEIEVVLFTHPDVIDVGVVGRPDEKAGELPTAFVVRRNKDITEKQLQDFVAERLSPQKWLRGGVKFVEAIPKNSGGKILRKELMKKLNELRH